MNDHRLSKKNGKPLGFINPLLYSFASSGLTDIASGSNPGCGTEGKTYLAIVIHCFFVDFAHIRRILGFPASKGWDPVSSIQDEIRILNKFF